MYNSIQPSLLEVKDLCAYLIQSNWLFFFQKIPVLTNISFKLRQGETLAITGDAGSGKSTLLKILNNQIQANKGEILYHGKPINDYERMDRVRFIRMLYPNPDTSINPHVKVNVILQSPLQLNTDYSEKERNACIDQMLEYVGLQPDIKHYYPSMLTTSQKLRLSLARALILEPAVLLVDTAIEKLDAQLRSHFLNIFLERQQKHGTALIICLNDLGLIRHMADKVLVLNHGMVEEYGSTAKVFVQPQSEMTKRILQCYNHEYRCLKH